MQPAPASQPRPSKAASVWRNLALVLALVVFAASCSAEEDLDSASDAVSDVELDSVTEAAGDAGDGADAVGDAADDEDAMEDEAEEDAMEDDAMEDDAMEDDEAGAADSVDQSGNLADAAGNRGDVNLSIVITAIAEGVGELGTAQQQAAEGATQSSAVCDAPTRERASPTPSQVELEVIEFVDDCLQFRYTVADFRSFVDDVRTERLEPNVIAVSPLLLDYRLNQIESEWPSSAVQTDFLTAADGPTGDGVVIALIDSGVDLTHPAIGDIQVVRAPDSGSGDYAATGHGTIAAAILTSPLGPTARGIAPGVTILDVPADLCSSGACGCDPCAPMTPAEAIHWSVDNGADIISMSFGYLPAQKPAWWQLLLDADETDSVTETLQLAIAYATASNVAMVAAAGNCANGPNASCETENQFELPAGHGDVVGVAALEPDDDGNPTRAWYSTEQSYVDIAAPGTLRVLGPDGEPRSKAGTSYATPFVSAALAVLVGQDGPLALHDDALAIATQVIFDSASDLEPAGRDSQFGFGQLQIDEALARAQDYARENPAPTPDAIDDSDGS